MRMLLGFALLLVALGFAGRADAARERPARISAVDARYAARMIWTAEADLYDVRLVIGPCRPAGRYSRRCVVRLGPERHVLVARYANADREVLATARRETLARL